MATRCGIFCAAILTWALAQAPTAHAQAFDYGPLLADPSPQRVGDLIDQIAREGRGDHYFMLTYCSSAPGVVLPPDIRSRYPDEVTIVLQWQYWYLERKGDEIHVTVMFARQPERLVIPLSALTYFSDPSEDMKIWLRPGATGTDRCADAAGHT